MLDASSAQPLTGTEGATDPFWSPDSDSIGFYANNALKRVDLESGEVQMLAGAYYRGAGGSWTRDDTILFANPGLGNPGLFRVSSRGGDVMKVTRLGADLVGRWPAHRVHVESKCLRWPKPRVPEARRRWC